MDRSRRRTPCRQVRQRHCRIRAPGLQMKAVLYASSEPALVSARTQTLRREGVEVVTATDLRSLERALRTLEPDFVLLEPPIIGLTTQELPALLKRLVR